MSILETSIGQIMREISGSKRVFQHYAVDCKDEQKTLKQAIEKGQLNQTKVTSLLAKLQVHWVPKGYWLQANDSEVITYILIRSHQVHRVQLAQLIRLAQYVEALNDTHPLCPHGLTEYLIHLQQTLEQHMQKEENILFPMLESGQGHLALGPIDVMRAGHEEHIESIQTLDVLTHAFTLPKDEVPLKDSVQEWRSLYLGIAILKEDLQQHIDIENNILFARYSVSLEDGYASVL
ncbi:hemerythrin domain-containing protein [uncultured Shewanella sp.]|uniref:hemerythrin domain-containing protein n=1 Tax=uncultured Shewanella sp. TaxID=173975 RepID=UPI00261E82B3|nr:hemerythrin domain-containing protein [uncultured Shewanella sp.]